MYMKVAWMDAATSKSWIGYPPQCQGLDGLMTALNVSGQGMAQSFLT